MPARDAPARDAPAGDTDGGVPAPDGLVLLPFRALRYALEPGEDLATRTSPPYDVIDEAGVARLEALHRSNVVRLILPRDDAGVGSRYEHAARTLRAWIADGTLRSDPDPALYVYEEIDAGHVQRGLIGAVALADPDANIILPHENTMAGPVADRLALTVATEANLEPIFLLYDGAGAAGDVVATVATTAPLVETVTGDGVRHRLWAITDGEVLGRVAADLHGRRAVIADGHHRYATYRRYQADRHAAGAGAGPWDFGLALLVDAAGAGPQVHPIHRVVPGLPYDEAVRRAGAGFAVQEVAGSPDDLLKRLAEAGRDGHAFVLTDGTGAALLTSPAPDLLRDVLPAGRSAASRGLDVTVAHLLLIRALWGLEDTESVVGYRHDAPAAVAAARESGGVALLLNATPADDVVAVAAAGERMPRKSTLFTPKPATGLVIRRVHAGEPV